jgi:hypothetical protein
MVLMPEISNLFRHRMFLHMAWLSRRTM